jgi:hypothetical protein
VEAETRPPEDVIQVSESPLPASSEPSARLNFDAARAIPFEPIAIAAGGTTSGSPPAMISHGFGTELVSPSPPSSLYTELHAAAKSKQPSKIMIGSGEFAIARPHWLPSWVHASMPIFRPMDLAEPDS